MLFEHVSRWSVFTGKAPHALLYAFPFLLVGAGVSAVAPVARPLGYAFAIWGTGLYLYSGALYLAQFVLALTGRGPAQDAPPGGVASSDTPGGSASGGR